MIMLCFKISALELSVNAKYVGVLTLRLLGNLSTLTEGVQTRVIELTVHWLRNRAL